MKKKINSILMKLESSKWPHSHDSESLIIIDIGEKNVTKREIINSIFMKLVSSKSPDSIVRF